MSAVPLRLHTDATPPASDDRLLIDARELSRITSLSLRTVRRMDSCQDIPGRIEVRRRVLFRLDTIREWVALGCPDRDQWQRHVGGRA